jgi:hypothetical protein
MGERRRPRPFQDVGSLVDAYMRGMQLAEPRRRAREARADVGRVEEARHQRALEKSREEARLRQEHELERMAERGEQDIISMEYGNDLEEAQALYKTITEGIRGGQFNPEDARRAQGVLSSVGAVSEDETLRPRERAEVLRSKILPKLRDLNSRRTAPPPIADRARQQIFTHPDMPGYVFGVDPKSGKVAALREPPSVTDTSDMYAKAVEALTTEDPDTGKPIPPTQSEIEDYIRDVMRTHKALEMEGFPQRSYAPPQGEVGRYRYGEAQRMQAQARRRRGQAAQAAASRALSAGLRWEMLPSARRPAVEAELTELKRLAEDAKRRKNTDEYLAVMTRVNEIIAQEFGAR